MSENYDVIIIGGGLAGASAAAVLSNKGINTLLIDQREQYPACFKAEKIEESHASLFRKLGLLGNLLTGAKPEISTFYGKKLLKKSRVEQYGYAYQDMVNEVRNNLPQSLNFRVARVDDIKTSAEYQTVVLKGGDNLQARLIILATGTTNNLFDKLNIGKKILSPAHSLCFGFSVAPVDKPVFDFEALTYHFENPDTNIGYVTFFKIGSTMRINLFTYWDLRDTYIKKFKLDPCSELIRLLPGLSKQTGAMKLIAKVEAVPVTLYKAENFEIAGLVLIGDAFQSVCPTTGTGLDKVLTDVDVLCNSYIPSWLKSEGMGLDKVNEFYRDETKRTVDKYSLHAAFNQKKRITDRSLSARINRNVHLLKAKRLLRYSKIGKVLRPVYAIFKPGIRREPA